MADIRVQTIPIESEGKPRRFVFVLLDQFTLLCYACAVESLRIANRMAGMPLYEWRVIGEGGETATCSAGTAFRLDGDLDEIKRDEVIVLCGGIDVASATTKRLLNCCRMFPVRG